MDFDINQGIAVIAMDDGKKNTITPSAKAQILAAIQETESNADAILLAGRPDSFCAGFDLATMTDGDREAIDALGKAGTQILLKLYGTGRPLVAACTGHAFTIGALWLLACDTRIGQEGGYKFGMTAPHGHGTAGLGPGAAESKAKHHALRARGHPVHHPGPGTRRGRRLPAQAGSGRPGGRDGAGHRQ